MAHQSSGPALMPALIEQCAVVVVNSKSWTSVFLGVGRWGVTSSTQHHQEDGLASSPGRVSMGTEHCAVVILLVIFVMGGGGGGGGEESRSARSEKQT